MSQKQNVQNLLLLSQNKMAQKTNQQQKQQ